MKYYYNDNGELKGPFRKSELVGLPITAETLVWIEGMDMWKPAREVPMFADILDGTYVPEQPASPFNLNKHSSAVYEQPQSPYAPRSAAPEQPYAPQQPPQYGQPQQYAPQQPQYVQPQQPYGQPQQPYGQPQQSFAPQQPQYGQQQPPQYGVPVTGVTPAQPTASTYGTPNQYAQPYPQQPMQPPMQEPMPSQHSGWTITGIVLSGLSVLPVLGGSFPNFTFVITLILGIVGLSKGNSVPTLWRQGDYQGAKVASRSAKIMGQLSVFIWIAFFVFIIILITILGLAIIGMAGSVE